MKSLLEKRYVYIRPIAYIRYIELEGGKPSALYVNPGTIRLLERRHVFTRIRAYLRYIEPERVKPSVLYQNPGAISFFEN